VRSEFDFPILFNGQYSDDASRHFLQGVGEPCVSIWRKCLRKFKDTSSENSENTDDDCVPRIGNAEERTEKSERPKLTAVT
jgi:hypothetical protein